MRNETKKEAEPKTTASPKCRVLLTHTKYEVRDQNNVILCRMLHI